MEVVEAGLLLLEELFRGLTPPRVPPAPSRTVPGHSRCGRCRRGGDHRGGGGRGLSRHHPARGRGRRRGGGGAAPGRKHLGLVDVAGGSDVVVVVVGADVEGRVHFVHVVHGGGFFGGGGRATC